MWLVLIVLLVVRREQVVGDLFAGIDGRIESFARMVGVAAARRQLFHLQPFVKQEVEVAA